MPPLFPLFSGRRQLKGQDENTLKDFRHLPRAVKPGELVTLPGQQGAQVKVAMERRPRREKQRWMDRARLLGEVLGEGMNP